MILSPRIPQSPVPGTLRRSKKVKYDYRKELDVFKNRYNNYIITLSDEEKKELVKQFFNEQEKAITEAFVEAELKSTGK